MAHGESEREGSLIRLLDGITTLLSGPSAPGEVLPKVLALIANGLPCQRLASFEYSESLAGYRLTHHHGLTPASHALLDQAVFPPGEPFQGLVHRGQVLVANEISTQTWLSPEFCQLADIGAYVALPLRARGSHLGALIVARAPGGPPFHEAEVLTLTILARQIALAVETKALLAGQRQQIEHAQAQSAFSRAVLQDPNPSGLRELCRLVCSSVGCDLHQLWAWDNVSERFLLSASWGERAEEREVQTALGINPPFSRDWRAALDRTEEALFLDQDLPAALFSLFFSSNHPLSLCVIPLRHREEVSGFALSVLRRPLRFRSDQLALLRSAAQIETLALDHLRAARALEEAHRLRSDFVAAVSHELRTPLNVLLGYCDLLLTDTFGPLGEEQRDIVRRLELRSRELADLVANTLDFNRLQSGSTLVQPATVQVQDLIEPLILELRHLHEPERVLLSVDVTPPELRLRTDPGKLRLILKNLVGNALKFTPAGEVRVRVQRTGGLTRFEVRDTGIGIPQEALPTIFDAYRQAHAHTVGSFSGVGLGLFIVHRLVQLLKGSVQVRSEVNRGTTFTVLLPDLEPEG